MTEQMRLSDTAKAGACRDQEGAEAIGQVADVAEEMATR